MVGGKLNKGLSRHATPLRRRAPSTGQPANGYGARAGIERYAEYMRLVRRSDPVTDPGVSYDERAAQALTRAEVVTPLSATSRTVEWVKENRDVLLVVAGAITAGATAWAAWGRKKK